ncbi:hypothetical protein CORC01_10571 [Colletotrichum orchidophilum]|uniref:Uncharacterized protein n=1 Tax=Colletotrichum orchidophilum TaxID=1209926 RepID=A0A1G4AY92_9PEZI|nr:uncharacterized protein CORC01_10571 [Colletotrichum orchidophilum]OHE94114.1 hypothetical protein CORC01_10571 [Colletotrichum orchidophilum]
MINMTHIRFLVHFSLALHVPELEEHLIERDTQSVLKSGADAPISCAISSPCLLGTCRASSQNMRRNFSAIHFSYKRELFHHLKPQKSRIKEPSCVPLVLFSALRGRQLCIDALAFRSPDFDAFSDCYINFARIHRDLRVVFSRA